MSGDYWTPEEAFAHIPAPPGGADSWHQGEAGDWHRCLMAWERVLISESSDHCPCCGPVFVSIVGVQASSGHMRAGISLEGDSELNSAEARKLAVMLIDAADALDGTGGLERSVGEGQ